MGALAPMEKRTLSRCRDRPALAVKPFAHRMLQCGEASFSCTHTIRVFVYILDVRTMTHQTYVSRARKFIRTRTQRAKRNPMTRCQKPGAPFRDDSYEVTRLFWFRNISSPWKGSRNYEGFVQSRMRPKHDVLVLVRCVLAPVGGQSAIIAKTTHTS